MLFSLFYLIMKLFSFSYSRQFKANHINEGHQYKIFGQIIFDGQKIMVKLYASNDNTKCLKVKNVLGNHHRKPVMGGNCDDEETIFELR